MDIVIVAQYLCDLDHLDESNGRFVYLAKLLTEKHNVEIITTTFIHSTKKQVNVVPEKYCGMKITALYEPGYPRNVCIKRFYSHNVLAKNVNDYLEKREKPDLIYAAVPSLSVAEVAAKYCEKYNVRFVVDIQDLWPEAFKMVFPVPVVSELLFFPLKRQADRIYKAADEIVAVSDTYVKRALIENKKCKTGHAVFLGTQLSTFDENARNKSIKKPDNEKWLGYCGTLGASYDITSVLDALVLVKESGYIPPKFIVMGDGPRKIEFEEYAKRKKVDSVFLGHLPYDEMCGRLCACDMVVNPITKGAAQSIINKHADYAAAGLPVINTQECKEYRALVEEYQMGINCRNNCVDDVANAIIMFLQNPEKCNHMGANARRCAEERFDRKFIYGQICNLIKRYQM